MSGLVTVPGDALPGLLGVGAVCVTAQGERRIFRKMLTPGSGIALCWADDPDDDLVPRGKMIGARGLFLILHDPADEYVSRAGMAAALAALHPAEFADKVAWLTGKVGPEAAESVRAAILAAAGRNDDAE